MAQSDVATRVAEPNLITRRAWPGGYVEFKELCPEKGADTRPVPASSQSHPEKAGHEGTDRVNNKALIGISTEEEV